jgi:hypothetical protein
MAQRRRQKKTTDQSGSPKPRVFLSHSSKNKPIARDLATWLKGFDLEVWFDDWEISVGDSIVDKVFSALSTSDTLVILLSRASVKSRWVSEELNSSVMRQLSDGGVRVLPALLETCTVPASLRHIKYADFRKKNGHAELIESLQPTAGLWNSLRKLFDTFCYDLSKFNRRGSVAPASIEGIYRALEEAISIRTKIELRGCPTKLPPLEFFQKLELLESRGINTRSWAFADIGRVRFLSYHGDYGHIDPIKFLLGDESNRLPLADRAMELKALMEGFCFSKDQQRRKSRRVRRGTPDRPRRG